MTIGIICRNILKMSNSLISDFFYLDTWYIYNTEVNINGFITNLIFTPYLLLLTLFFRIFLYFDIDFVDLINTADSFKIFTIFSVISGLLVSLNIENYKKLILFMPVIFFAFFILTIPTVFQESAHIEEDWDPLVGRSEPLIMSQYINNGKLCRITSVTGFKGTHQTDNKGNFAGLGFQKEILKNKDGHKHFCKVILQKAFHNRPINVCDVEISGDQAIFKICDTPKKPQFSCFHDLKFRYTDLFTIFFHKVYCYNHPNNHVSRTSFPGSKPIVGWRLLTSFIYKYFNNSKNDNLNIKKKKIFVNMSKNINSPIPDCTIEERLNYIDEAIPEKNKTAIQLKKYLYYIAHLHHNKPCKPYFITTERKIRWLKHVEWVIKSIALGPVINKPLDVKVDIEVPKYKKSVETFEIKTIEKVDYQVGETKTVVTKVKEEVVKPLFDFKYEIVDWIKGNKFSIKDVETQHVKTKTIPPFVREDFNPRNPYYITYEAIDKEQEPLKGLLENRLAFYNRPNNRFYRIDGKTETITKEIIKEKKEEDKVFFTEVEYEVPVTDNKVIKHQTKKEHDLSWRKVTAKGFKEKILESKDKIVTHNRFISLKPNKKLYKKTHFKFSNDYETTQEVRDFCRSNHTLKKKVQKNLNVKVEKEIKLGPLIEHTLNNTIKDEIKKAYPTRMKYLPKNCYIDLEAILRGLDKGFFTKKDLNLKKSFRVVAFLSLEKYFCSENIKRHIIPKGKYPLRDYLSDENIIEFG